MSDWVEFGKQNRKTRAKPAASPSTHKAGAELAASPLQPYKRVITDILRCLIKGNDIKLVLRGLSDESLINSLCKHIKSAVPHKDLLNDEHRLRTIYDEKNNPSVELRKFLGDRADKLTEDLYDEFVRSTGGSERTIEDITARPTRYDLQVWYDKFTTFGTIFSLLLCEFMDRRNITGNVPSPADKITKIQETFIGIVRSLSAGPRLCIELCSDEGVYDPDIYGQVVLDMLREKSSFLIVLSRRGNNLDYKTVPGWMVERGFSPNAVATEVLLSFEKIILSL